VREANGINNLSWKEATTRGTSHPRWERNPPSLTYTYDPSHQRERTRPQGSRWRYTNTGNQRLRCQKAVTRFRLVHSEPTFLAGHCARSCIG
jgi:hypothetical protein